MKLEKKILPPVVADSATITFDKAELEFLSIVMQHIGGSPMGPRGHSDRLRLMLADLGYDYAYVVNTDVYKICRTEYGIVFDYDHEL